MRVIVGDFETSVYENQECTEVWASALVDIGTEDVKIFSSIGDTYKYLRSLKDNCIIYYHNLKFDGSFWLSYLLNVLKYKQALLKDPQGNYYFPGGKLPDGYLRYLISDMGTWYSISFNIGKYKIELRDSLKLLPFSVKRIGESFKTKHQKTSIEYYGERHAGGTITDLEKEYISNDVMVVKEALEIMFTEGHNKLTIGACCLDEFRKTLNPFDEEADYPDVYSMNISENYGELTAGDYIHNSYKGGWCYLVKGKENKRFYNGTTADVNSLYPSMMSSESGNKYPIGDPHFWTGDIPNEALSDDKYYFVRIRTHFYLKENMLPCIQIKRNILYKSTEWLSTSDVWDSKHGRYSKYYQTNDGKIELAKPTLTLTMTDYTLIKEHYNLVDCEVLDGCWFWAKIGIFDEYINKYKKIKMESKGAKRELAKLFLNNLYGKMASSPVSSFKYITIGENKELVFNIQQERKKKAGYIPIGSAITSYARNFTIRAAQKNYYGVDKKGFIYADTDSIHCDLPADKIKGIVADDKNFCCWKLEASWDYALFVRQKTYIEHIVAENLAPIANPYLNIKCAGLPEHCKKLFQLSLLGYNEGMYESLSDDYKEFIKNLNKEEIEFISTKREVDDFRKGLRIPSKLIPKQIAGGIVLMETSYEMR